MIDREGGRRGGGGYCVKMPWSPVGTPTARVSMKLKRTTISSFRRDRRFEGTNVFTNSVGRTAFNAVLREY